MKIQTQAWLLVAGIVLAPLLIVLTNVVHRQFIIERDTADIPAYEDIAALLDVSVEDWESFTRFVIHSRNMGEVTVFRDDYLVLYSTNADFNTGIEADRESVFALLTDARQSERYIFSSRNLNESRVFILNKRSPQGDRPRPPPFVIPVFVFFIALTIFTVCMSIAITRTITNSVRVLENATRRIAEGELDLKVEAKGSNEITSLTNSLNKMRNSLKEEELKRSRFIMGITHDLKTPLALIKGYAEAIADGITGTSDATQIIIAKADQLESMISDLIDFVRMETGEWRELLDEMNITAFLHNMVKTLKMDINLLNHELTAEINLPENVPVIMDERLAQRALENLITNAVRYTPTGSIIRIDAVLAGNAVITSSISRESGDVNRIPPKVVRLTVSDNGPGLNKEDLPHVFEMFYRGTSSRREQGMGLGLAVVKWVVDYHGWTISAASEKGKGARFIIEIPLAKKNL
jgi:signal transduction histidine kinase